MSMIRLQHQTPSVYTEESRDFQLLSRLYDCVINGIQFDVSTMTSILDTKTCRDIMLPLLQTKLGFFSKKEIDNYSLRYILQTFPDLVKNKGSLKAIKDTIATYLKIINSRSEITIYYVKDGMDLDNGYHVPDNIVLVGINTGFQDMLLLEEIFKYILPVGIGYYFYFYSTLSYQDKLKLQDSAELLYVSHNINDSLRESDYLYGSAELGTSEENRLVGAIDTITLITEEEANEDSYKYFLGVHESENDFSTYITSLSVTPTNNKSIIIFNNDEYAYLSNSWHKLNYMGSVNSFPDSPSAYDVVYLSTGTVGFYMYNGSTWVNNTDCPMLYLLKKLIGDE